MTDNGRVPRTSRSTTVLEAEHLRLETIGSGLPIVEDVSIELRAGEIYGLVGESGSGKTTAALALLGYTQPGVRQSGGELKLDGQRIVEGEASRATYIPQNPGTALNPSLRLAVQIRDIAHANGAVEFGDDSILNALQAVGLPADRAFAQRFPHQLSGGQQQRVSTAAAIAPEPSVVVLDEPTTGLDVITQAKVLSELRRLCRERNVAMLYVTHDLGVVAQIADRIAVMYAGRIVESGPTAEVLNNARHPYTIGLLKAVPDYALNTQLEAMEGVAASIENRPPGCTFAPRCPLRTDQCESARPEEMSVNATHTVRCIHHTEVSPLKQERPRVAHSAINEDLGTVLEVQSLRCGYGPERARSIVASEVSFRLRPGGCVALVGESGSGKSTIARAVAGIHPVDDGSMKLNGIELPEIRSRKREQRRLIQIVFQNPMDALNPRHTIGASLRSVVQFYHRRSRSEAEAEVIDLLQMVKLSPALAYRYPNELSGGEAQRVGLARALAARPDVIVCDEITSALDVSSQAAVLGLLRKLQIELGLSLLFITHDIGVVAAIADEVLVLRGGVIVETGPTYQVLSEPRNDYTRQLIRAAPSISQALHSA